MKWNSYCIITFFFLVYTTISLADSNLLINCDKLESNNNVLLSFQFDKAVKFHCLLLSDPDRLVVDFADSILKTSLPEEEDGYIKKIRCSDHDHQYLRLVFDLKQKIHYSSTLSHEKKELNIKLQKTAAFHPKNASSPTQTISSLDKEDALDLLSAAIEQEKKEHPELAVGISPPSKPLLEVNEPPRSKKIIIIIDPGHGGKDPGAAGPHGSMEKNVVLKISKKLQAMLNEEPGFNAILTRTTDCYISLRKRLSIARKNHADLFIAIHADAYHHSHAAGASVYALSQRGATSEAAHWLAEKENESELGGLGMELVDKDTILRSVLIDLSQTHTIESSLQIGHNVLQNLGKVARLHHPRVEQAAFVVLKSPDIPSILVETGFLSNPNEEEKLIDLQYQEKTAYAIKEGIKQYFKANFNDGGWFSNRAHKKEVKVRQKRRKENS